MSNTSDSDVTGTQVSLKKTQPRSSTSNQNSQSQSTARDSNSPSLKQLNFTSTSTNMVNKTKKTPPIPSLTIQGRLSTSPEQSYESKNSTNTKARHHIQIQDISPTSHRNSSNDPSNQSPPKIDLSQNRAIISAPPIPRLNFAGMSRSCQSLNINRAPIPPMNVAVGARKTVSGFNLDLPEEYSTKNANRPVIICIPWTTIPTSAGANQANKNYNINNNLRSENAYSHRSQKNQNLDTNQENNNINTSLNYDDAVLSDLINSTFYSNRIFSTTDVLPNTVIIEEDEVANASTCNTGRGAQSSTSSPRSFHNAHSSLKLNRVSLSSNRNASMTSNSDHTGIQRTGSLTPNSPKSFSFLSTISGVTPTVVSEVSSDSIPSLQAIDAAYQRVQHFPMLIEQTTSESTHLTTYIESIIAEIELCREEKERLHVQNELIRSSIRQAKEEMKIYSDSQEKMKRVIEVLKQKSGT